MCRVCTVHSLCFDFSILLRAIKIQDLRHKQLVFECISGNRHRPSFSIQIGKKYWFYNIVARDVLFLWKHFVTISDMELFIIDFCRYNFSNRLSAGENHHILIIVLFFLVKIIDCFMCTVVRNVIHEKSQNNFTWKCCELRLRPLWKWVRKWLIYCRVLWLLTLLEFFGRNKTRFSF